MYQSSCKISQPWGWWGNNQTGHQDLTVMTKWGVVLGFRQEVTSIIHKGSTIFHFIYGQRKYYRYFEQCWSKRFTLTLATRFAQDVISGNFHEPNSRKKN